VAGAAIVFAGGFRCFFLAAGLFAVLQLGAWLLALAGLVPQPGPFAPTLWHGHEMVFGWAAAAIAGFLTTAVPVWTGTPPVAGRPLAALLALWLAGRAAVAAGSFLPPAAVAAADLAFLPALTAVVAARILPARQARNVPVVVLLGVLALANGAVHAAAWRGELLLAATALRAGIHAAVLLVVIVGGRITPAFTRTAFARRGVEAPVRTPAALEQAVLPAVALAALADLLSPGNLASGAACALAALVVAARMAGWQTRRALADPLVGSLHAGHAWIAVGYGALGATDLGLLALPRTTALHGLTAGAMGAMILAVMTRVGLGHTGRPLVAPRGIPLAYALVSAAALVRVTGPLVPAWTRASLFASGALWVAAFALFSAIYWPILTRPRPDGRAG
jgi:uncharacterized protein involved in response to NO